MTGEYRDIDAFKSGILGWVNRYPELAYQRLNTALVGCMIRRNRSSKINGVPIMKLPALFSTISKVQLSRVERQLYMPIHFRLDKLYKGLDLSKHDALTKPNNHIFQQLSNCRQACLDIRLVLSKKGYAVIDEETLEVEEEEVDPGNGGRAKTKVI